MIDKNNGRILIEQKIKDFFNNERIYISKDFLETENRTRFIDPFFEALGWELSQTNIKRSEWDCLREI